MADQEKKKGKKEKKAAPPPARKTSYNWDAANAAIEERRTREAVMNSGIDFACKRAEQKKTEAVLNRLMTDPDFAAKAMEVQDRINAKRQEAEEKKAGATEREAQRKAERERKEQDAAKLRALGALIKPLLPKVPKQTTVLVVDHGPSSLHTTIQAVLSAAKVPASVVLVEDPLPTIQETMEQLRQDLPELLPSAVIPVAMMDHKKRAAAKKPPSRKLVIKSQPGPRGRKVAKKKKT